MKRSISVKKFKFTVGMKVFAGMLVMMLFIVGVSGLNYFAQLRAGES